MKPTLITALVLLGLMTAIGRSATATRPTPPTGYMYNASGQLVRIPGPGMMYDANGNLVPRLRAARRFQRLEFQQRCGWRQGHRHVPALHRRRR